MLSAYDVVQSQSGMKMRKRKIPSIRSLIVDHSSPSLSHYVYLASNDTSFSFLVMRVSCLIHANYTYFSITFILTVVNEESEKVVIV